MHQCGHPSCFEGLLLTKLTVCHCSVVSSAKMIQGSFGDSKGSVNGTDAEGMAG